MTFLWHEGSRQQDGDDDDEDDSVGNLWGTSSLPSNLYSCSRRSCVIQDTLLSTFLARQYVHPRNRPFMYLSVQARGSYPGLSGPQTTIIIQVEYKIWAYLCLNLLFAIAITNAVANASPGLFSSNFLILFRYCRKIVPKNFGSISSIQINASNDK